MNKEDLTYRTGILTGEKLTQILVIAMRTHTAYATNLGMHFPGNTKNTDLFFTRL